ncbi:hypothetical protein [Agromyces aureus]|uniref:Uncharacterized protein n=1 Tax=Agromyces aureus TaxID=453304 RepID=A0A191WCY4_9MICO|nr:hypothetical protein [Agromyces aureus]ANJ26063.1 hypothetical protein ATC03_04260 [Agromyces aureus]
MTDQINYSVREFRHIVNRLLHALGAQRHLVNPARDVLLFAEASGFRAFDELERTRERVAMYDGLVAETPDGWSAGGQAGYYVAPTVIDLLEVAAIDGPAEMTLVEVDGADVFTALRGYAAVRGLALEVETRPDDDRRVVLRAVAIPTPAPGHPIDAEGPEMRRALLEGFDADRDQFWRLFHASDQALTPDTELSRRHAGTQLYDGDGNLLGEVDEESYEYIRSFATESAR